jgi:Kef-type K+ transport system membrane component KefB
LNDFIVFLIILASGVFFSEVFKRLHLPYVVSLLAAGIIVGPLGLDIIELTPAMLFLGSVGAVFLMFMAGMEVRTDILAKMEKKLAILAIMNGGIPAIVGFIAAFLFGYEILTAIIVGTIFISSSIAVIIPSLEEKRLISTEVGAVIIGAAIVEDLGSLILLSIVLQTADPTATLPLPLFIILVVLSIVGLKKFLPKIEEWFFKRRARAGFEEKLQFIFIVLIAVAVYFELLGMHAIVAGFLVGLTLSDSAKHKRIESKLHAISYGVFIPVFFLEVGMETDLTAFIQVGNTLMLTVVITGGLIASKFLSGYIAGRLIGFPRMKSLLIGSASIPQLSTSLVVAFTALELGLMDPSLQVSIVFLSVVTVLLAPFIVGYLATSATDQSPMARTQP